MSTDINNIFKEYDAIYNKYRKEIANKISDKLINYYNTNYIDKVYFNGLPVAEDSVKIYSSYIKINNDTKDKELVFDCDTKLFNKHFEFTIDVFSIEDLKSIYDYLLKYNIL